MLKKLFLGSVFFLLFCNIVLADGETFEIDFREEDSHWMWLNRGDRVLFEWGGYNHTVIVDEIKLEVVELDIFFFLEGWKHAPNYVFLSKKTTVKMDFEKDGTQDLGIKLISNEREKDKVYILFEKLSDVDVDTPIDFESIYMKEDEEDISSFRYVYAILFGVVILGISVVLLGIRRPKDVYF